MLESKLMRVNISQFNDDNETPEPEEDFSKYISDNGELDIDSLVNDFKEPETTDEPEVKDENHDSDHDEKEEIPDTSEKVEGDPTSETHADGEEPPADSTEKRPPDAAFAEMRRKAEQNEKFAGWVQKLAEKQGFTDPNDLISEFEKQQLAKEAQEKGVPVDVYERLNELEKENKEKEDTMFRERFNNEVAQTKDSYKLSDEQITEVFRFMGQRGYIDQDGKTSIPFEDAYVLANRETLVKDAEERGRQSYLEEKQKQQQSATPDAGTNSADKIANSNELDYSTEGIFKTLEKMGIDY